MNYKYAGKDFEIRWNDDGQFECAELGILTNTPDECKAEIRLKTEKEAELPRISVLFLEDTVLIEALSNLKAKPSKYYRNDTEIWVSWKRGKSSERAKKNTRDIYADTPENRELLSKYIELEKKAYELSTQARATKEKLEKVKAIVI